jgi:hypothetical protein
MNAADPGTADPLAEPIAAGTPIRCVMAQWRIEVTVSLLDL